MLRYSILSCFCLLSYISFSQTLELNFVPSFQAKSHFYLTQTPKGQLITFKIDGYDNSPVFQKTINDPESWNKVNTFFKTYSFQTIEQEEEAAKDTMIVYDDQGNQMKFTSVLLQADGITVYGVFNNQPFSFWSPEKDSPNSQLFNLVAAILDKHCPGKLHLAYLEALEMYFPHALSFKKTGSYYRLYGYLELNDDYINQLESLIASFPANSSVLIEATNFKGMDTAYYPYFRKLLKKNARIRWLAPQRSNAKSQLMQVGVKKFIPGKGVSLTNGLIRSDW